jgi:hypothetical protein
MTFSLMSYTMTLSLINNIGIVYLVEKHSGSEYNNFCIRADVAELADAPDLGSGG